MMKISILSGPIQGEYFEIEKETILIGRSGNNDVQVPDWTVSRKHLKLSREGTRYYVKDLHSKNGTFVDGKRIAPGIDREIYEGSAIVIGKTLFCIGASHSRDVPPLAESGKHYDVLAQRPGLRVSRKTAEFIHKASSMLMAKANLPLILERLAGNILELLKRGDRAAIILLDKDTGKPLQVISQLRGKLEDSLTSYSHDVVDQVIRNHRPVIIADVHAEKTEGLVDTLRLMKIGCVLCVPLLSASEVLGAIYVDSIQKANGFRKEDLTMLDELGKRITEALDAHA